MEQTISTDNTTTAMNFITQLIGTKYLFWHPGNKLIKNEGPFWAFNGVVPDNETIKSNSCCCVGVTNLMRRKVGLSVPFVKEGYDEYAGGTAAWFKYLTNANRLEQFDITKKYPIGTMFLRNYHSPSDQGHVSVLTTNNHDDLLDELIIHSYSYNKYDENVFDKSDPGITLTVFRNSHYCLDDIGYYTHVCLPDNWLNKD
jgi:hypothetical protein